VPLPGREDFADRLLRFGMGDRLDRELLLEALERAGYERVDTVVEVGQWSVRGGIVDIFSPSHPAPARLEFFGDDIESIRLFDPTSQRSVSRLDELLVVPLHEGADSAEPGPTRLLDYLPATAPVIVDAPKLLDEGTAGPPGEVPLAKRLAGRQTVELALVAGAAPADSEMTEIVLDTQSVPSYSGQFRRLAGEVERWRAEGFRLLFVAADAHQAEHLQKILREQQLEATMGSAQGGWADHARGAAAEGPPWPVVLVGECSSGFSIPQLGLVVLTEQEIFGARRRSTSPARRRNCPL